MIIFTQKRGKSEVKGFSEMSKAHFSKEGSNKKKIAQKKVK